MKETTGWQYHLLASEMLSEAGTFLQTEIGKTYKYSMRCTKLDYCLSLFEKLPEHKIFCFGPCTRMHQLLRILLFLFYQNLRYYKGIIGKLKMYDSIPNYTYYLSVHDT